MIKIEKDIFGMIRFEKDNSGITKYYEKRQRRRQGWRVDEGLRVECWNEQRAKSCCNRYFVRGIWYLVIVIWYLIAFG